jgi:hypothetical protein
MKYFARIIPGSAGVLTGNFLLALALLALVFAFACAPHHHASDDDVGQDDDASPLSDDDNDDDDDDDVASEWSAMDSGASANLSAIWGFSGSDVFVVGEQGTILHYEGTSWTAMAGANANNYLTGVWGSSHSDVFAVGCPKAATTILHFDGASWSPVLTMPIGCGYAVWGFSPSDVFVSGGGLVLHFDGTSWSSTIVAEQLFGLWGSSHSDVFGVGEYDYGIGLVVHYNGVAWSVMTTNVAPSGELSRVWGTSPSNVYAVGYSLMAPYNWTFYCQYNGAPWWCDESDIDPSISGFTAVWGLSPNDLFAVGGFGAPSRSLVAHFDGRAWTTMPTNAPAALGAVWGSSATDVFAVGEAGTILHYNPAE